MYNVHETLVKQSQEVVGDLDSLNQAIQEEIDKKIEKAITIFNQLTPIKKEWVIQSELPEDLNLSNESLKKQFAFLEEVDRLDGVIRLMKVHLEKVEC